MPGDLVGEEGAENPSAEKKNGSARTSKKSKRRNVIRYMDWSVVPESVNSSPPGVQQQAPDLEEGDGASSELAEETIAPTVSTTTPDLIPFLDCPTSDTLLDYHATASGSLSPPDAQDEAATPSEFHSSTTNEHTENYNELQRSQEEQKADDWPSENMRPNAQNLRYGGYPAQPAPQNRNTPLGSGRLQSTTKLGAVVPLTSGAVQWNADVFELIR